MILPALNAAGAGVVDWTEYLLGTRCMDKGVLSLTEKALRPIPMAADVPPMIDPHFHFLDPVQNPEQHVRAPHPAPSSPRGP